MRKMVQEGSARLQTNQKIWMHISQKISLDYIWFAHGFPTSMYNQKGRNPLRDLRDITFSYLNWMQLHLHKYVPNQRFRTL